MTRKVTETEFFKSLVKSDNFNTIMYDEEMDRIIAEVTLHPTLRKQLRHRIRQSRSSRNRKRRNRNLPSLKTRITSTPFWLIQIKSQTHGRTSSGLMTAPAWPALTLS